MNSPLSLAAVVVLAGAVLVPNVAHAAAGIPTSPTTTRTASTASTCETTVLASAPRLDLFASPQVSGRSLLGQLVPGRTPVTVDAVAGDNYSYFGVPDLTRTWYELTPVRPVNYTDRWSGDKKRLTQKAWIHKSALAQTSKWLRCEATLTFVPPTSVPQT